MNIKFPIKALILTFLLSVASYGQEKTREVSKFDSPDEPIKLTEMTLGSKKINQNKVFLAENDWLQKLSLEIENASDKDIVYMQIELQVNPSGNMKTPMRFPIEFGSRSIKTPNSLGSESKNRNSDKPLLSPGKKTQLSITPEILEWIKNFLEENRAGEVERVKIFFEFVIFKDDTAWSKGFKMIRNPQNSDRWDVLGNVSQSENLQSQWRPYHSLFDIAYPTPSNPAFAGFFFNESIGTENVLPEDFGSCVYFTSQLPVSCSETYSCAGNLYCIADKAYGTRNPGMPIEKGVMSEVTVPCIAPEGCSCLISSSTQTRWEANAFCTERQCPSNAVLQCNLRGGEYDFGTCKCIGGCIPSADGCSPIIIDVLQDGFALTNPTDGVSFDMNGDGLDEILGWTQKGSDDAFLTIDLNNNGKIDSGKELFGNFTAQPNTKNANGFIALAEFDKTKNGGNGDGVINSKDSVFTKLLFWNDINHNGQSETNELQSIQDFEIAQLDLAFQLSDRVDQHGNRFKYTAKIWDSRKTHYPRWAWDVFLVAQK